MFKNTNQDTFYRAFLNLYYTFITYDERKSNKQRAKSNEQRAKSNKQRAKSNEQRANSDEQRAKTNERRAKGNEQLVKTNEQRAKTNEQRAKSSASYQLNWAQLRICLYYSRFISEPKETLRTCSFFYDVKTLHIFM